MKFKIASLFSLLASLTFAQENNTWKNLDENENYTPRHECSFVQAGENFILFGGRESAKRLEVYNFKNDSWSVGGAAPIPFNHFQATSHKGLIWVIGAFRTNNFPNEIPATHIYMYNPATKKWTEGLEIPRGRRRGGAGLTVYNNKFYIVGGNTVGHNGGYVPWLDEYDPMTGTWKILDDMPNARDHFQVTTVQNKLYAIGGRRSGGEGGVFAPLIPQVDVYDFKTNSWSTLKHKNNIPTPRAAPSVVNFNDKIYVMGGEGAYKGPAFKTVEVFNPLTNHWTSEDSMLYARHGTQAIVSGNGIFTLCGSPNQGGGRQKNLEVYGENTPKGTKIVASKLNIKTPKIYFDYNTSVVNIELKLQNTEGNTAIYLNDISLSGHGFKLEKQYNNLLLNAHSTKVIKLSFTPKKGLAATGLLAIKADGKLRRGIPITGTKK